MRFPLLYFGWLQKGNPTGKVDRFPELRNHFETSVPGIYCIGDLTGVPLIKLAAESGFDLIERFQSDTGFQAQRKAGGNEDVYDFVIAGAGPAGVAAAIRAKELGYRFLLLESSRVFNTVVNYPKSKPIYVTPPDTPFRSALSFTDGTKESLLSEISARAQAASLPIREGEMVMQIVQEGKTFAVQTGKARYRALRVVVAIGKTGNARMLGVPGEKLPKVLTRLIDPAHHADQDVLVVGGGDSALEAANALAMEGNRVTLSYRKPTLSRPKERNVAAFDELVGKGKITPLFKSQVKEITANHVTLKTEDGEKTIPNQAVYGLIGTEIPIQFFQRSRIRMEGEKTIADRMMFLALLLFSSVLYFGKSVPVTEAGSLSEFLRIPFSLHSFTWGTAIKVVLAWASFIGMIGSGIFLLGHIVRGRARYFSGPWVSFKTAYYGAIFLLFAYIYLSYNLSGSILLGWVPWKWYSAAYSLTILVFGLRRIQVNPTGYIKRQTWTLILIQIIPLFLLPVVIFPWMGEKGLLGTWITQHIFPNGSYWRSFGLILAWPLSIHNLALNQAIPFWLVFSIVQTFLIIPYIVYKWGKGSYCGWICSCGALAETLGDEYRTKAPHGPMAKKWDNAGQVVLWFAVLVTLMAIANTWFGLSIPGREGMREAYALVVDIVFAGVLGVGVYFFMSGRVWCRFFCPLAALMHIYARFSVYRIFSNKKRCISCNICTKVCHMGIDVMGHASKGIPMNDVECVRCSACVVNCPMDVLTFGRIETPDLDNIRCKDEHYPLTEGWQSGLPEERIGKLLEERGQG